MVQTDMNASETILVDEIPTPSEIEEPSTHTSLKDSTLDEIDEERGKAETEEDQFPLFKYSRITGSLPRLSSSNTRSDFKSKNHAESPSRSGILSVPCQCVNLGKVVLVQNNTSSSHMKHREFNGPDQGGFQEYSVVGDGGSGSNSSGGAGGSMLMPGLPQLHHILALGMMDGSLHLIDPCTGRSFCPSECLNLYVSTVASGPPLVKKDDKSLSAPSSDGKIDSSSRRKGIVDVLFDSSGSYLAAITQGGDVSIFEFRFGRGVLKSHREMSNPGNLSISDTVTSSAASTLSGTSSTQPVNMFESFLSKLAGDDRSVHTSQSLETNLSLGGKVASETVSTELVVHSLCTARFNYHKPMQLQSSSQPTCIAIDPSYRRRKEKAIVVGFEDGRLILTKRSSHGGSFETIVTGSTGAATVITTSGAGLSGAMGIFLQPRRRDVEIYHGMPRQSTSGHRGIEALTWRGSLIAWADSSGIKIFDVERMARIAHVDRPSGGTGLGV